MAIPTHDAINALEPPDLVKFGNIRFSSHRLFEISQLSFSQTIANQGVDWPNL
jgi:hypothetical protein